MSTTPERQSHPYDPERVVEQYSMREIDRDGSVMLGDVWQTLHVRLSDELRELHKRSQPLRMLSVGCGTGRDIWTLANYHALQFPLDSLQLSGISKADFSGGSEEAEVREAIREGKLHYETADITTTTLADESQDFIMAYELLVHIGEPGPVIKNMWNALSPGGLLVFNLRADQDVATTLGEIRPQATRALEGESPLGIFTEHLLKKFPAMADDVVRRRMLFLQK